MSIFLRKYEGMIFSRTVQHIPFFAHLIRSFGNTANNIKQFYIRTEFNISCKTDKKSSLRNLLLYQQIDETYYLLNKTGLEALRKMTSGAEKFLHLVQPTLLCPKGASLLLGLSKMFKKQVFCCCYFVFLKVLPRGYC